MSHRPLSSRALLIGSLLAIASASCGDDSHTPTTIPCDIREARCRHAIFTLTAQVRGQSNAKLPPTRIITRAQFATETRAAVTQSMTTRDDQVLEATLRLLHLLPATSSIVEAMADSSIEGVAAYYDGRSKAVTIIDDAAENESSGSLTLSHEYTHALQDQRENLDTLDKAAKSTDQVMAVSSLVEGEATILSDVTMSRATNTVHDRGDTLAYVARVLNSVLMSVEQSDAPFNEAELVLPYPVGGLPVAEAYFSGGSGGIQALYRAPATTLTGWVQRDVTGAPALPVPLSCDMPDPPSGYARSEFDRLGGTGLIALYTRLGLRGSQAYEAARAWTNDSFTVFAPMGTDVSAAFAWRIGLLDEAAASTLESQLRASTLALTIVRQANEVVLTGATDPAVLAAWAGSACTTQKSLAEPEPKRLLPAMPRYW